MSLWRVFHIMYRVHLTEDTTKGTASANASIHACAPKSGAAGNGAPQRQRLERSQNRAFIWNSTSKPCATGSKRFFPAASTRLPTNRIRQAIRHYRRDAGGGAGVDHQRRPQTWNARQVAAEVHARYGVLRSPDHWRRLLRGQQR